MHSELLLKRSSMNSCMPKCLSLLRKSINQAHLENGTYEQIVLKGSWTEWFGSPRWIAIKTVTQQATQQNSEKPKPHCHHCKSQVNTETSAVNSNEKKTKPEITRVVPTIAILIMVVLKQTLTPTIKFQTIPTRTIQKIRETEDLDLSIQSVRPVVELTTP